MGSPNRAAVQRADRPTGQRRLRCSNRDRPDRSDAVGGLQPRCNAASRGTIAWPEIGWYVRVVEFRRTGARNGHPVDRGFDVRHHAGALLGRCGSNALVRLAANDGPGNGSTVAVNVESRPHLPRRDRRRRRRDRLHRPWYRHGGPPPFVPLVPARVLESRSGVGVGRRWMGCLRGWVCVGRVR